VLKDIPVIFISALNETLDKVKAFHVGGVDYLTKPFHFEEVYARIQTHLLLHRLEKLRLDLTHMVVHDLRNPLTVICYFLDLLEMDEGQNLSASARKLVPSVRRCAEELRNMISSILDVSKMEAGEMALHRELCDLNVLIRDVVDSTQPLPDDRSVTFEDAGSVLTVRVDSGLIRRVFQNLLSNALKYTPMGGVVRIVAHANLAEIRVAITDMGRGIAPEYHQQIFEKFGQVEVGNNRQGTGLGLTFCKMAVEAHGGHIGVESEVGKGSTFWITLPCPGTGMGSEDL
jgi:signal transduction histidine kinase